MPSVSGWALQPGLVSVTPPALAFLCPRCRAGLCNGCLPGLAVTRADGVRSAILPERGSVWQGFHPDSGRPGVDLAFYVRQPRLLGAAGESAAPDSFGGPEVLAYSRTRAPKTMVPQAARSTSERRIWSSAGTITFILSFARKLATR